LKLKLNIETRVPLVAGAEGFRQPNNLEKLEMNRILRFLEKAGSDPNVQEVILKKPLSHRQILYFLSSGSPELINFLGILLAYSEGNLDLNTQDRYSIILHLVDRYPSSFPVALRQFGLSIQDDLTDVLKNIRVRVIYKRRPKRSQRPRGYRDRGNLPSQQSQLRRKLTFDEAAEEAYFLIQRDRELSDTLDFLIGLIQ
jgi:hypothetical protein